MRKRILPLSIVGILWLSMCAGTLSSCNIIQPIEDPITYGDTYIHHLMSTDKAAYLPGQTVHLTISNLPEGETVVRYSYLGEVLHEEPLSSTQWTWTTPNDDYRGYMAYLIGHTQDGHDTIYAAIGIDVSSDPARFPRNGFLSKFDKMSEREIAAVMDELNRYHINYVQFQDWHWKHHHPLAGSVTQPMDVWTDIISRNCYRTTVQGYIDAAHERGMATLFYNLAYGVLDDYQNDGVSPEWLIYTDPNHATLDRHPLSSPFKSSIYLANPANDNWLNYLRERNDEVYAVYDFDGWQIDQLGGRGKVYTYAGERVDLPSTFGHLIAQAKAAQPNKRLVMNAVSQYGQKGQIAAAPIDFCYTEVWSHSNTKGFTIFSDIITANYDYSQGKQTVLAAYLNYKHGRSGRGLFNTPGVLMATAAATVWGGTILQMGEHMLCNEYFPNDNLSMSGELTRAMIDYYDFTVAYENVLREGDNTTWYGVDVLSADAQIAFNQWAPKKGQIATVGRHVGKRDIVHLLSYRNATHLDWCDTDGNQPEPDLLTDVTISFAAAKRPLHIYVASPDYHHGVAEPLDFTYDAGTITLAVPAIKYWTMLIVEYEQ